MGNAAHAQETGPFGERPAVQPGLVHGHHHPLDLVRRETGRIKRPNSGSDAGASHSPDTEPFALEHTQHTNVRNTAHAAATKSKSNVHVWNYYTLAVSSRYSSKHAAYDLARTRSTAGACFIRKTT